MSKDRFGYGSIVEPYEDLRQKIKEATDGLGGLILTTNKKTGEKAFVLTYAGSEQELADNKHDGVLQSIFKGINSQKELPKIRKVSLMSQEKSDIMQKGIEDVFGKMT